jgi:hypothetical protein
MSKTTDWYLQMLEDGTLRVFQSITEDIDYEEVTEELLTLNPTDNDH